MRHAALLTLLCLLCTLCACVNWDLPSNSDVEAVFAPVAPSAMLTEPKPVRSVKVFNTAKSSEWSELCQQCHRGPNYSSHTIINWGHKAQCIAQSSCAGCHGETLHKMDVRGNKAVCFDCHMARKLPVDCSTCHISGWKQQHSPHGMEFVATHGAQAKPDPSSCLRCHGSQSWCTDCHGISMPHPAAILSEHPSMVKGKPETCAKCHGSKPCETCHTARGVVVR